MSSSSIAADFIVAESEEERARDSEPPRSGVFAIASALGEQELGYEYEAERTRKLRSLLAVQERVLAKRDLVGSANVARVLILRTLESRDRGLS